MQFIYIKLILLNITKYFILDFKNNDDIYTELEDQKLDKEWEKERKIRSIDEMTVESTILANLFKDI